MSAQVVIVGGGVAGLSAALALANLGVEVQVFESRTKNPAIDRGDVLQPGIVPVLEQIGAREAIDARDPLMFRWFRIVDAFGRVQLEANTVARLGPGQYFRSLRHREILAALETVVRFNRTIDIRMGDRVLGMLLRRGRVVGVRSVSGEYPAALTIIASGGSTHLGDPMLGPATIHRYHSAFVNARVAAVLEGHDAACYVLGRHGATVLVPLPRNEFRVGLQLRQCDLPQLSTRGFFESECAARYRPFADSRLTILERPRTYRLRRTVRQRWAAEGIAIVGDAAHQVHPVGGQGMNLAIRDAVCLVHSLARYSSWDADGVDNALQHYSATRRCAVRRVQALTHVLGHTADQRLSGLRLGRFCLRHMPETLVRGVVDVMLDVR